MKSKYRERVYVQDAQGNHVVKWATGNTKKELQAAVYRPKAAAGDVVYCEPISVKGASLTLAEYATQWLELYRKAELKESTDKGNAKHHGPRKPGSNTERLSESHGQDDSRDREAN